MDRARLAGLTLRADAVANAAVAGVLVVAAGPIAGAVGVSRTWPLLLLAGVLGLNGAACWRVARRPQPLHLRRLAAFDVVFVVAVVAVAALNPGDASAGVRWMLTILGDVVAVVAAVKLWCARETRAAAF